MPIYEYRCSDCRTSFEFIRSINQRDDPARCPTCGASSSDRVVSLFSAAFKGGNGSSRGIAGGNACAGCTPSPTGCAGCGVR